MATTANRRKGNHIKGDNETLQEAVDRVYGPGEIIVETTECFEIHDGLTTLNTDATKEERKGVHTKTKIFLATNNPGRFSLHMVNSDSHVSSYFRAPWKISKTYIKDYYRSDSKIVHRIVCIKDYTYENKVYSWHSHDGAVNFGKDPVVEAINVIEEAVVNVASGVIEVC
jgi:hypothetical protein